MPSAIAAAGCRIWNVKIDVPRANISAAEEELRKESIRRNKEWLDAAAHIGSPHARICDIKIDITASGEHALRRCGPMPRSFAEVAYGLIASPRL